MQNQLLISLELMCLIDWLLQFGKDDLKNVIKKAVSSKSMFATNKIDQDINSIYDSTIKFFEFLEDAVEEELDQNYSDLGFAEDDFYISMRDKLDSVIDFKTIWMSIKKAKFKVIRCSNLASNIHKNKKTKDEFFKQVIRSWKPGRNSPLS
jgi:hypothetical protein